MIDETEIVTKPESVTVQPEAGPAKSSTVTVSTGTEESKFAKISIRAWIALIVVATICVMSFSQIEVKEPLYTLGGLIVGFYFGQKNK